MAAKYPNEPDALPTTVEDRSNAVTGEASAAPPGTNFHAKLHNNANAAINAIETTLGNNPQGAESTVAAAIANKTLKSLTDVSVSTPARGQAFIFGEGNWKAITPSLVDLSSYGVNSTVSDNSILIAEAIMIHGNATYIAPPGELKLENPLTIAANRNLVGSGVGATVFVTTGETAGLKFEGRGGKSGGFTINGNYVGAIGLTEITCTERLFQDIKIEKSTQINWDKNESQNCTHINCASSRSLGKGIRVRDGASNNHWYRTEVEYGVEYHVSFEQTRSGTLVKQPTNNWFHGGVFERSGNDQGHATANKMLASIWHEAGSNNGFFGSELSLSSSSDTETPSLIIVSLVTTHEANASRLILHDVGLVGTTANRTCFDLRANSRLVLTGNVQANAFKNLFLMEDSANAYPQGKLEPLSITNFFANNGGTKTQDQIVFGIQKTSLAAELNAVTNEALRIFHVSASGYDMVIRGDGIYWPNAESFTATAGPHDCAGKGSPESVVSARIGSIYRRTDGTEGSVLYLKVSGTGTTGWKAIA